MAKTVTQLTNTGESSDKEQLLSNSFYSLPDNPSNKNFTASQIKGKGYKPSLMIFDWFRRLVTEVNSAFSETDSDISALRLDVGKIKTGLIIVPRAERDKNSKVIHETYETKSDATDKLNTAKSYADTKKSEAIASANSYSDTKKQEAISSANAYADTNKLPKSEPVLTQMSQSDNAVTSKSFVAQSIAQAIAEADDSHITGISFSETSRGVWVLTVNRKDLDPLTAQFDIPESMILDTTNPPRLEGTNLILTFQGGSTVSVDMTGLVDVYTGFEGSTITTTVENNVIKATLKQTWVDFLNTAESSEATRVSNENTRISNESARQTAESSRASAELQRGKAFMFNQTTRQNAFESSQTTRENTFNSKLTEWGNDYSTAKAGWNSQVQAIVTEYGRQPATEQEIRGLRTNG